MIDHAAAEVAQREQVCRQFPVRGNSVGVWTEP
jgi:hypothetical protein